MVNVPLRPDLTTTCPLARWSSPSDTRIEYGIPCLEPCAIVACPPASSGEGRRFRWCYQVKCAITGAIFRSRLRTREDCLRDAEKWVRFVKCPGDVQVPVENEP